MDEKKELLQTIQGIADWLHSNVSYVSSGPDHPPEIGSQFDYEMEQAGIALSEACAALAQTAQGEVVRRDAGILLRAAETVRSIKQRNRGARGIDSYLERAATMLERQAALTQPPQPQEQSGEAENEKAWIYRDRIGGRPHVTFDEKEANDLAKLGQDIVVPVVTVAHFKNCLSALEFYASKFRYGSAWDSSQSHVMNDKGKVARDALSGVSPSTPTASEPQPPADTIAVPPSIGDYVLATKYSDGDPGDPWALGFYAGEENGRHFVNDSAGNTIRAGGYRRVGIIREDVGHWMLNVAAKQLEQSPPGTVNLWSMLTDAAKSTGEDV